MGKLFNGKVDSLLQEFDERVRDNLNIDQNKRGVSGMQQKPHLQRRSDFVGNSFIAEHNDAGILVTREGNTYHLAVELDVDSVVEVATTQNSDQVNDMINELLPKLPEIRERFGDCLPD
jgi:hypothetical protein